MKTSTKIFLVFVLIVLAGVIVYAATSKPDGGTVRIGFVAPLTGDASTYGEPMKNAAALAVEEINAKGGINGRPIEVFYEDSKCKGKDALTAVQKLISVDRIKIIDGFTCAEDLLTAAPVIESSKVFALAPGASSPDVTNAGDYIFQNNPSSAVATRQLAELMSKSHTSVAVISEQTGFAQDINDYFIEKFKGLGGTVVSNELYTPETRDFRSLATKIKEARPEAIFVNPQTEIAGGTIIRQLREVGAKVPLYGMDTISGQKTIEIAGKSIEGLTVLAVPGLSSGNEKAQAFLKNYTERFGKPSFDLYLGASYDSIYLLAQAIEAVGENPTRLKDYFYDLPSYSGVIGTYGFDENGDLDGIDFTVKKIHNGKLVEVR